MPSRKSSSRRAATSEYVRSPRNLNIVHISDIHTPLAPTAFQVESSRLASVTASNALDVLFQYLKCITEDQPIDYLIVSGDITDRADPNGHSDFSAWLTSVSRDLALKRSHILVVPGNHDVDRTAAKHQRLASFLREFSNYYHPYIADMEPSPSADVLTHGLPPTPETNSKLPFIYDRHLNLLIYLFDSTTTCAEFETPAQEVESQIEYLSRNLPTKFRRDIEALREKYVKSLFADAPSIGLQQIKVFAEFMRKFNPGPHPIDEPIVRIAVLHHHVGHIITDAPEPGSYSSILDAGRFKNYLTEAGFHLVLHGHKHINFVGQDAVAFNERGSIQSQGVTMTSTPPLVQPSNPPLLVVASQTISGAPTRGDRGFNFISIERQDGKAKATIRQIPLIDTFDTKKVITNDSRELPVTLGESFPPQVLTESAIRVFRGRSVTIRSEYEDLLKKMQQGFDIMGLGLSSFREDWGDKLLEMSQVGSLRILLLDPSFPMPEDNANVAAIREQEESLIPGQIRSQVAAWWEHHKKLRESIWTGSNRTLRGALATKPKNALDGRVEIKLYRVLPMINLFRIDDSLFLGPYLINKHSRHTATLLLRKGDESELFSQYMGHFEDVWNRRTTRPIQGVTAKEVADWKSKAR